MDRITKGTGAKVKKKMTKQQIQLAIIKKKETDSKALTIVEQLLEPEVDPEWLLENLVHINKCHMEDVIEERAITKLCGYVLCKKPLTVVINQRYHISLKNKKVYDVTKRKNFCSSKCFGASNYLLEQMLTSPLWLRDEEEIPKFQIFCENNASSNISHGEELDIAIIEHCLKDQNTKDPTFTTEYCNENVDKKIKAQSEILNERQISKNIQEFTFETIKNINCNKMNLKENQEISNCSETIRVLNETDSKGTDVDFIEKTKNTLALTENNHNDIAIIKEHKDLEKQVENKKYEPSITKRFNLKNTEKQVENENYYKHSITQDLNLKNIDYSQNTNKLSSVAHCNKILQSDTKKYFEHLKNYKIHKDCKTQELNLKKKKQESNKKYIDINLATKVEKSFQEWITEETIHFLFGDDFIKKKAIENIEQQNKYSLLCKKLNKLQFQDQQEDSEILKPKLKSAPHFAVLQEEGQKLDVKVRAFYKGTTIIKKDEPFTVNEQNSDSETYLPLIDVQAPHVLRRKIFLDRLDQILPDLLRTLAGNNEVYARKSCNYTSIRCTAVKALVYTFSLSPKNIIFKTVEWILVGLVIIKMLSLLDPWLATLLLSQQANMYISMILTSYKLDPHYLNLLVTSFNPNMNPK